MTPTLVTHYIDQLAAEIREQAANLGVTLHDASVTRAVRFVVDSVLAAGMRQEPDHERVANGTYVTLMAWRELVG